MLKKFVFVIKPKKERGGTENMKLVYNEPDEVIMEEAVDKIRGENFE